MDSFGEVDVPPDQLCGARTQRSLEHDRTRKLKDSGRSKRPLSIVIIISGSRVRSPVETRETVLRVGSLELDLIYRTPSPASRSTHLRPPESPLLKYPLHLH